MSHNVSHNVTHCHTMSQLTSPAMAYILFMEHMPDHPQHHYMQAPATLCELTSTAAALPLQPVSGLSEL